MSKLIEALEGKDFYEILEFLASIYKDNKAITDYDAAGETWNDRSYKELFSDVENIAGGLQNQYKTGTHIAICAKNSYNWIVSFFGIVCSGNIAVLLDREMTNDELRKAVQFTDSELLISDRLPISNINCSNIDIFVNDFKQTDACFAHSHNDKAPAIFLMTSGVTSSPKCVVISQANLIYSTLSGLDAVPIESGLTALSILPLHHCFELCSGMMYHLFWGSHIIINDKKENFFKNLYAFKPECLVAVPSVVIALLSLLKADISSNKYSAIAELKYVLCGGAGISPTVIDEMKEYGVLVLQGYGMTECSPGIAFNRLDDATSNTVGSPLRYVSIRFDQGEILVKGPNVMIGYYKNEHATEQVMQDGWLRTGDVGKLDENGHLILCGRVKNVIVLSNGENVFPEELEERVMFVEPAVKYCKVFEENGVVAIEVFAPQLNKKAIEAAIDQVNENVSKFKKINRLIVLQELPPVTSLGKAIRRK